MPTLNEKIANFKSKYYENFDPHALVESARIDAVFASYRFDGVGEGKTNANNYFKALTKTLSKCIDAKTKINKMAIYDLSNINLATFVREFEDIMDGINAQSSTPRERKPYEGIPFDKLIESVKKATSVYDKPLHNVWSDKILNKKLSYENLKAVTDYSITNIERDSKSNNDIPSSIDLENVVRAHEAMKVVRQSRSWLWKAFHLYQNYQEGKYLEALSSKVQDFWQRGYDLSSFIDDVSVSTMEGVYKNTNSLLSSEKAKKLDEKLKEMEQLRKEGNLKISAVEETLKPVIENPETKNVIADEIVKKLPYCRWGKPMQKAMLLSAVLNPVIAEAQSANNNFDSGMVMNEKPNKLMVHCVKQVFNRAYLLSATLGYNQPSEQLVTAQIVTDVILKNLSPVAVEGGDKYATFANGYVLNNPLLFNEITGMDGSEPVFIDAQKTYSELNREEVKVDLVSNNEVKAAPVEKVPSNKVPAIEK